MSLSGDNLNDYHHVLFEIGLLSDSLGHVRTTSYINLRIRKKKREKKRRLKVRIGFWKQRGERK
jgi:hypothetical protein